MKKGLNKYKKWAILFAILLLPAFIFVILNTGTHKISSLPYYGPRDTVMTEIDGEVVADTVYHKIPDFSFTDQHGNVFNRDSLKGDIYVANFFFTRCPTICPKMTTNLVQLQDKFSHKKDFHIVSHTVDPKHDSVQVLAEYAEKAHAGPNWHFLTGDKDDIYKVANKGYFASAMKDTAAPGGFLHTEKMFLIDREGHIREIVDGTQYNQTKNDLVDAIQVLYAKDYVPKKEKK